MNRLSNRIFSGLLDWIYPRHCVHCGGEVEDVGDYRFICARCRTGIFFVEPPHCISCGFPFWGQMVASRHCPKCRDLQPVFEEGRSVFLHRAAGSTLVHALKYEQATYLRGDLARMIRRSRESRTWFSGATLVPVPLHPRRERERGFNQSAYLCGVIAGSFPGVAVAPLLERTRDTPSQTRLGAGERRDNVKNAFAIRAKAVLDARSDYIIVDDVFTTGATLNACARVLARADARRVRVFTLAHG